jgi:RNA polymerase sigma factor (TIGR02999 family)
VDPYSLPTQQVNDLLDKWKTGDRKALNELVPVIYKELHGLAHYYLQGERSGHTLQTTALVNEAYLRLAKQGPFQTESREHLVALAARLMRQILVDYARSRRAEKRGPDYKLELTDSAEQPKAGGTDVVVLDDALTQLAEFDPRQSLIVELRFFGGMTLEETAAVLGISVATTKRDWSLARAWLARELGKGGNGQGTMGQD